MPKTHRFNGVDYRISYREPEFLRAMADVLDGQVSVTGYGAVGDGVEDDTGAIQVAINNAQPGTTILLPRPRVYYRITRPITVENKTGVKIILPGGGLNGINIRNESSGVDAAAAFHFKNSNRCGLFGASIQNTDLTDGIGAWVTNLSYEIQIRDFHVTDGLAGLKLGDEYGGSCFNVFVQHATFYSAGVSVVGTSNVRLRNAILFNAGVNLFFDYCYAHGTVTAFKRVTPIAGPNVENRRIDNVRMNHCIAETNDTFGYDMPDVYGLKLIDPYVEKWGVIDATPLSAAINLGGLTYAQHTGTGQRKTNLVIQDPHFYDEGCGGATGQGILVKVSKYFHSLEYTGAQSTPGRTTHLQLDDADNTDRGDTAGRPQVFLRGALFGNIVKTNSQAIIHEEGITGDIGNIDTVSPGSKADVGTGVARAAAKTTTSSRVFADHSWAVWGSYHMARVIDTDGIAYTKFTAGAPNDSFNTDRFHFLSFADNGGGYTRSSVRNARLDYSFDVNGTYQAQGRLADGTGLKDLAFQAAGGWVQFGAGAYTSGVSLGGQYVWPDAAGRLRTKVSVKPVSEADGAVLSAQKGLRVDTGSTVTVGTYDHVILSNPSGAGAVAVNLPATATAGREIIVKDSKGNAAVDNITINRGGSSTIDGATTVVISANFGVVRLVGDGTNWAVV